MERVSPGVLGNCSCVTLPPASLHSCPSPLQGRLRFAQTFPSVPGRWAGHSAASPANRERKDNDCRRPGKAENQPVAGISLVSVLAFLHDALENFFPVNLDFGWRVNPNPDLIALNP